jgi:hypothetical protein
MFHLRSNSNLPNKSTMKLIIYPLLVKRKPLNRISRSLIFMMPLAANGFISLLLSLWLEYHTAIEDRERIDLEAPHRCNELKFHSHEVTASLVVFWHRHGN